MRRGMSRESDEERERDEGEIRGESIKPLHPRTTWDMTAFT